MTARFPWWILVFLIASCLTGCSVIPGAPWNYTGWIGVLLSSAAWFMVLVTTGTIIALFEGEADAGAAFGCCIVVYPLLLWGVSFCDYGTAPAPAPAGLTRIPSRAGGTDEAHSSDYGHGSSSPSVQSLENQLDEWRTRKNKLATLRTTLKDDKEKVVRELKAAGVRSGADLRQNDVAKVYADELLEIVKASKLVEREEGAIELAITTTESLLRRVRRQELIAEAGITDAEMQEFANITVKLNESLQTSGSEELNALQLEDVLKQELDIR